MQNVHGTLKTTFDWRGKERKNSAASIYYLQLSRNLGYGGRVVEVYPAITRPGIGHQNIPGRHAHSESI